MDLGSYLKYLRKHAKLTMKELAVQVGVSEGFISQLENNVTSPSVVTLRKIGDALGSSPGDILNACDLGKNLVIVRRTDWSIAEFPHTGFQTRRFLPPEDRKTLDTAILTIETGKEIPSRKAPHTGEETFSVLAGTVDFSYGDETYRLGSGDSIYYKSNILPHRVANAGDDPAVLFWVGIIS